jgi:hypothetical protein
MSQGDSFPLQIPCHWPTELGSTPPEDSDPLARSYMPVFRAQSQPASLN